MTESIKNEKFELRETDFGFQIRYVPETHLTETRIQDGQVEVISRPVREVIPAAAEMAQVLCNAAYDAVDKLWHCDIDAGMQRWRGYKPNAEIINALRAAGFEYGGQVRDLIRRARKKNGRYAPRF